MGWKSTKTISRDVAIKVIKDCLTNCSDETLASIVESVNDDEKNEYPLGVGYNFIVREHVEDEQRVLYERLKLKFGE